MHIPTHQTDFQRHSGFAQGFTPALNVSNANIDEMLLRLARAFSRVRTAQLQCRKGIAV